MHNWVLIRTQLYPLKVVTVWMNKIQAKVRTHPLIIPRMHQVQILQPPLPEQETSAACPTEIPTALIIAPTAPTEVGTGPTEAPTATEEEATGHPTTVEGNHICKTLS